MKPSELEHGAEYRTKNGSIPMTYVGLTKHKDKLYHEFWEPGWTLGQPVGELAHWIDPEDVEPI